MAVDALAGVPVQQPLALLAAVDGPFVDAPHESEPPRSERVSAGHTLPHHAAPLGCRHLPSDVGRLVDTPSIDDSMHAFFDRWESMQQSIELSPASWNEIVHSAVLAKRAGDDATSVAIYVGLMLESGTLYSGLLGNLYKPLACSGHLREAAGVLLVLKQVLDRNPVQMPFGLESGPSSYDLHYPQLRAAVSSQSDLEEYLTPFSGRPGYAFPRDFETARRELVSFIGGGARLATLKSAPTGQRPTSGMQASPSSTSSGGGGCYIATAVYGSYDAPEVLVLRRFRDEVLATSRFGRAAIRAYYVVSPPIADGLRTAHLLNRIARWLLDHLVIGLRSRRASDPTEA
ncbi:MULTISPECIES: CFI-box-CTERM domain-containing protein [unclassified Agrococcus]|uniref:CFI-box-CTERM domain-containing protein n=1 Tax=unclassified Agrococcus TaxID=2615065 RepID=UPI0036180AAB